MAKGTESDEFVVLSSVRAGLKREFAFAFKSQSEIGGYLGRTRSAKPPAGAPAAERRSDSDVTTSDVFNCSGASNEAESCRFGGEERKGHGLERTVEELGSETMGCGGGSSVEECVSVDESSEVPTNQPRLEKPWIQFARTRFAKKPVPEQKTPRPDAQRTLVDEDRPDHVGEAVAVSSKQAHFPVLKSSARSEDIVNTFAAPKSEMEHPRPAKKFPSKLKELLETRILEGLRVRYLKGPKVREAGDMGLVGVVKGPGILCHCGGCLGVKCVSPTIFEQHAGSANKRPPEYIHLDNGNTLRSVITACQNSSLVELEETVQRSIGVPVIKNCRVCFNCRGSIPEAGTGKTTILCDSCTDFCGRQPKRVETADDYNNDKSSEPVFTPELSNLSQSKSQGRLTKKDSRLHKLVFEDDVLQDGTEVAYYARGKKLLVGYKKGSGIICSCCNTEVSPSQFESHAGWATRRKPYLHIYTSNGVSLHELALSLSRDRKFSNSEKDDLCFVCREGGDLVCCSGCPRAFHAQCTNVHSNPGDAWYCKLCQNLFEKDKYVENNANARAAGRVMGTNPIEQITNRCIRIMNTEDIDFGGCALCKGHDFSKSGFDSLTVLFCDQCEKEFHVGCLKEHGLEDLKELPEGMWFCCIDCEKISQSLQKLIVRGPEKLTESLLNIIKKKHGEDGLDTEAEPDVKWRIINRKVVSNEETESLLSRAVAIFHDRFSPITDPATSRDLIPEMLYGNSFMGQDFSGMYCAALTVNGCVVSAAIFRIYGSEVAELPLVATNAEHQGQGYFQALFSCVQMFLSFMNVRNLVLPSAVEAESIWTKKFGFSKLATDRLKEYKRQHQMMIFQGTTVLSKSIPKCRIVGK